MRSTLTALAFAVLAAGQTMAAEANPISCTPLYADMEFCGSGEWQQIKVPTPDGIMIWKKGDVVGKVVMEMHRPGTAPDAEEVMEALKKNVRDTFKDPSAVTFTDHSIRNGEILDQGIIAYDLDFQSYVPRVHHSFFLGQAAMMQFLTYTDDDTEEDALLAHFDFVKAFKFKEVEEQA